MIRWTAVIALLAAALGTAFLAGRSTPQRGLKFKLYDNLRWRGDPVEERITKHLDYAPNLRRNRLSLPDRSSLELSGVLMAPRGGKYDFAIAGTDDTWLKIDGQTVVTHRRGRDETIGYLRLSKGFHRFEIKVRHRRGESRLQVQWRLPSGYMNLEALPPVFVYPEQPAAGQGLPTALRFTPLLLLLLALLVAVGPWLATRIRRLRTESAARQTFACGLLLIAATLGMRLWDLNGAGETSDEWAYASAGRIYVSNLAHGYIDSLYWHANEEHPPIGKYLYGIVSHAAGSDDYSVLRFASACCAALTVLITFLFGARFFSLWVGLVAGLVLVFLPPFVAHGKVAALDSPSCTIFTLAVYLFVVALRHEGPRNLRYLAAGLVACLAFATKFSNATLFVFMAGLHFASEWKNIRRHGVLELPIALYVLPFLPLLVLLVVWPWLWREPFGQLITTLQHWDYPIQEWFLGRYRQPPVYYFPVVFLATTPALLLVPLAGFFAAVWRRRSFLDLTVLLWFLTPFLWTVSVLKQDGIRYIYNMYPALALMIAIGALHLVRRLPEAIVRPALAGAIPVYLLWQCFTVHPYYVDYYSEAVGGTERVFRKSMFEVGWWGEGMDRAYTYVNDHAPEGATWDVIGVVNHTSDMLRDDLEYNPDRPEWLVKAYLTPAEVVREGYEEVFRVEVDSAPLVIVYVRSDLVETE